MNTDKIIAESIAKDYAPKESSKIVALKKLDNKAKLPATIFTYSFGIVSALVFGTGMCLAMQVIGSGLVGMVLGIVIVKKALRTFLQSFTFVSTEESDQFQFVELTKGALLYAFRCTERSVVLPRTDASL